MSGTDAFLAELREDLRQAAMRAAVKPRLRVVSRTSRPRRRLAICAVAATLTLVAAGAVYAVTNNEGNVHRVRPNAIAPTSRPDLIPVAPGTEPNEIVHQVLNRLGDRALIIDGSVAKPPTGTPKDSLWLSLNVAANPNPRRLSSDTGHRLAAMEWEAQLVASAVRDELWVADSKRLIGWQEVGPGGAPYVPTGLWSRGQLAGWFTSPPLSHLHERLARLGRQYGFTVISVDALRPVQIAPRIVIQTNTPEHRILTTPGLLRGGRYQQHRPLALKERSGQPFPLSLYEGWSFEARDSQGPFLVVTSNQRGIQEEHAWVRDGLRFRW